MADTVSDGILGIPWNGPCAPEKILPGGKWSTLGNARVYTVVDKTEIPGLIRKGRHSIAYQCNSDGSGLFNVSFTIPPGGDSYHALVQRLGKLYDPAIRPKVTRNATTSFEAMSTVWPGDSGYFVSVTSLTTNTKEVGAPATVTLSVARPD